MLDSTECCTLHFFPVDIELNVDWSIVVDIALCIVCCGVILCVCMCHGNMDTKLVRVGDWYLYRELFMHGTSIAYVEACAKFGSKI